MNEQDNKIRCNMHLEKENLKIVKEFIQGAGLSLSLYIDLLVCRAAEQIEDYYIKMPSKKTVMKNKVQQIDKMRFNMNLDKRSVCILKEALKKSKLTFSAYINFLFCKAAKRIQDFYCNNSKEDLSIRQRDQFYCNIWEVHKILGLIESDSNSILFSDEHVDANTFGTLSSDFPKNHESIEQNTGVKKNKK